MSTATRKFPQLLALTAAFGVAAALSACQQKPVDSADTALASAEEQQAPPPAEPNPSAPSDVSGGGSTAPAADAANTAPPADDAAVPPPADDATGESGPPPADEGK